MSSILDVFPIFNLDNIPTNTTSSDFGVYGHGEINILPNHFFPNQDKNMDTFIGEWKSFKFDLLSTRKRCVNLKKTCQEITSSNNIHPLKVTICIH